MFWRAVWTYISLRRNQSFQSYKASTLNKAKSDCKMQATMAIQGVHREHQGTARHYLEDYTTVDRAITVLLSKLARLEKPASNQSSPSKVISLTIPTDYFAVFSEYPGVLAIMVYAFVTLSLFFCFKMVVLFIGHVILALG